MSEGAGNESRAVRGTADGSSSGISGEFVRGATAFRDWVTADGSSGFRAEPNRYHLYVSYACPWASRAVIVRRLKGLEGAISMSVVDPLRDERGWRFGSTQADGPAPGEGLPGAVRRERPIRHTLGVELLTAEPEKLAVHAHA